MARCAGTSSAGSTGTIFDGTDVFTTTDNDVRIDFFKGSHRSKRVATIKGDPDLIIDLAHQLIGAAQRVKEIKDIRERRGL